MGPRNCIGQHFSVMTSKIILIQLFRRYDWTIARPECVRFQWRLFLVPEQYMLTAKPRHKH